MAPLEAALLVALIALPFHLAIRRELRRMDDPCYLRTQGVVIASARTVTLDEEVLGRYMGRPIAASVTFKGMRYRFDRVTPARKREAIGPGELYLEPGLVYRAD